MILDIESIIEGYYEAFNQGDLDRFLGLLTEDVVHDINQGRREVGHEAFARFMAHMNRCYRERVVDLVVFTEPSGRRAAAEFVVEGTYLETDQGLPPANGQRYRLAAGAFFELRDDQVARVTSYHNLPEWTRQVSGE